MLVHAGPFGSPAFTQFSNAAISAVVGGVAGAGGIVALFMRTSDCAAIVFDGSLFDGARRSEYVSNGSVLE